MQGLKEGAFLMILLLKLWPNKRYCYCYSCIDSAVIMQVAMLIQVIVQLVVLVFDVSVYQSCCSYK
jgi:hypothetical protein